MEKKCDEKHEPICKEIKSIRSFLFGETDKTNEVSFASKVNLMFKDISDIKKWFLASLITIVLSVGSGCIFFGKQLQIIESNSQNIKESIEYLQSLDKRISTLEVVISNLQGKDVDIQQVGNMKSIKIKNGGR